jgi:hypothetical protein
MIRGIALALLITYAVLAIVASAVLRVQLAHDEDAQREATRLTGHALACLITAAVIFAST